MDWMLLFKEVTFHMHTITSLNKQYTVPETIAEEAQYRKDIGQYKQWACPLNQLFVWPTKLGDVYQMGRVKTWLEVVPNTDYWLRVFSVDTQPNNVYAAVDPLYSGQATNRRYGAPKKKEPAVISIADLDSLDDNAKKFIEKFGLGIKGGTTNSFEVFSRPGGVINNKVLNWDRLNRTRSGHKKCIFIRKNDKATFEAYTILDKETRKVRLLWSKNVKDIKAKDLQKQADDRGMTVEELVKNKLTHKDIKLSSERTVMLIEHSATLSQVRNELEHFEAMLADVDSPMKVKDCRALRQALNTAKTVLYKVQHHKTTKK